jgi:hypothetical protein
LSFPLATAAAAYRILREELLKRYPELEEDETALLDTLEGMTSIQDQLAAILRSAKLDEAHLVGLKDYQDQLIERKVDLQLRAARKRKIVLHYMEDIGLKTIVAPDLTATRRAVAPAVIITDDTLVPEKFLRWKSEVDKTEVKAALKAGESVPGAHLSNGGETLAIKT